MTEMATEAMHEQLRQPKPSIFDKFKNNLKSVDKNIKDNKISINSDDSLCDKTFFAFLQDLLNDLFKKKSDKNEELLKELKINEALSKEKFFTLMTNELEQNQTLSKEVKEQIGKNIQNKYVQDLTFGIVKNKLGSQEQGENTTLNITTKDVVKAGLNMAKNPTPIGIAQEVVEKVASKITHKITK
ncbi:hypothetical protein [Helicobacter ganmani]|uniref:hypothetical protein n=1 Tax=Helicobacter ganmani TaxID=60246 RepID=UPI003A86A355